MKLFYSPTSPYVRKVMAVVITRGLEGGLELVPTNPHTSPPDLLAVNPLSKVPCLVTNDGVALYDSPVICEFLDQIGDAPRLFPAPGPTRWRALTMQALGDGILDAAVARRLEHAKPQDEGRHAFDIRQKAAVHRALAALDADPPGHTPGIGGIAVAVALGYLEFRFAGESWRGGHARLDSWFEQARAWPGMTRTTPRDPA